ncbi:MAG TPA: GNAT family N-acetyltransferase [Caldilineaceae bacterium]|nr:GNAT family N-acetyltransferase [Caldilineaceae bacterium]
MSQYQIRPLTSADQSLLWEMLYQALYVPPGAAPFAREIVHEPELARLVENWGRPGDLGVVAVDPASGVAVGAAWLRLFSAEQPGFAYVDAETPELGIAVLAAHRGRGAGTQMLQALLAQAAQQVRQVALSVQRGNPAQHLYERFGFITLREEGSALVMLRRVAPAGEVDKVNVCIVGLGWTGSNHYAGYAAIPEKAQVLAVVARSAVAKAKAKAWGIPKIYSSFDAALQDDEIHALSICTPHYDHAPMLLAGMAAGKHVIGETPACMTLDECRALRNALYRHPQVIAATGHICRSWPTFAHAKQLVSENIVGQVFALSSNYTHKADPQEYAGSAVWGQDPRARLHLGISYHSVDLLRWIAGDVAEVSGDYTDHARVAVLRFKNGALGHVYQSGSVVQPYMLPLYVYGLEGSIHCFWEEDVLQGYLHQSAEWRPTNLAATPLHGRGSPEWRIEMENFVDSIRNGNQPVCPLAEGLATVETCVAIDEAMRIGGRVKVST